MTAKVAIVLLSGGLDSATVLAMAQAEGYQCHTLNFNYHQRHSFEVEAATRLAANSNVTEHKTVEIDLSLFGGSALTDESLDVPTDGKTTGIPITYVPARNTIFLSFALAWAEVLQARDIFIGVNAVDYSGYPDCRPEYIEQFEKLANLATKSGVEGDRITLHAPLIRMSKAEIIRAGIGLKVDYSQTVSCYNLSPSGQACRECDACRLRINGFLQAGVEDPTVYR